jgi:hypothetical protein
MSRILARISDILRLQPQDISPTLSIFPSIDERSIAIKLGLGRLAETDGKQNIPASEAHDLGASEQMAISALTTIRQQGLSDYAQEGKLYEQRMQSIDLDGRIAQISLSIMVGINTLKHTAFTGRNHLYAFRDDVREKEEFARNFRDENRLRRPPREKRNAWLSLGILGVMFLIETSVNGVYLSANNVLGLIGGVGAAFGIAFVNLMAAVLLGRGTVYANHVRLAKKLAGILAFLVAVAVAAAFNLLVAHFRDAAAVMPWDEAANAALRSFLAEPLQLRSFESVVLLAIGLVFAVIAFLDGLTWSDLYPGYASIVSHRDEARTAYADEVEAHVGELVEAKNETLAAINTARSDLASTARNYLQAFHGRVGLRLGLPVFLDDVDQKANALLAQYREANRTARTSEPPKYFAEKFAFSRPLTPADEGTNGSQLEALNRLTDQADQVLEERAIELLQVFEAEMREYEALKQVAQHG